MKDYIKSKRIAKSFATEYSKTERIYYYNIDEEIPKFITKIKIGNNVSGAVLRNATQLTYLDFLDKWYVHGNSIETLVNLKVLIGSDFLIGESVITALPLTHLYIGKATNLTNWGLEHMQTLTHLKFMGTNSYIRNSGIKALKNLEYLDISKNGEITDKGIKDLINLTHLEVNFSITDIGIINLINLKVLLIQDRYAKITDKGLQNLHNLEYLKVNLYITDKGIQNLQKLKYLDINTNANITLKSIKKLPNLRGVKISGVRDAKIKAGDLKSLGLYIPQNVEINYDSFA